MPQQHVLELSVDQILFQEIQNCQLDSSKSEL